MEMKLLDLFKILKLFEIFVFAILFLKVENCQVVVFDQPWTQTRKFLNDPECS